MRLATKMMFVTGGVAMSMFAGSGMAAAAPDTEAIVNSTCTYPQIIAAVNAQDPAAGQQITSSPIATGYLQSFVASGPEQRRNYIAQAQAVPEITKYYGLINTVAATCNNY
jgi:hemophore-related protein